MALTANQIKKVRNALHESYSQESLPIVWTKPDVDAVIGDADTWQAGATASYVASLSEPFASASGSADKALLLIAVLIADRLVNQPSHRAVIRRLLSELQGIEGV